MALLVGALYWVIHGSLEWFWQIGAVTLPALLLAAAGLSEVDAHAGTLWPQLARWGARLRVRKATPASPKDLSDLPDSNGARPAATQRTDSEPDLSAAFLTEERRSAQYASRRRRRTRRFARRQRARQALVPRGRVSRAFRVSLGILSCLVLVGAGLPFLSLQMQDAAVASIDSNPQGALSRARIAALLQPADPGPADTTAYVYLRSAETATVSTRTDRGGAVLDDLALALSSQLTAVQREPADWSEHYGACTAVLNILLASEALAGNPVASSSLTGIGVDDWSDLNPGASSPLALPPAGQAANSLANTQQSIATATNYRNMSSEELLGLAEKYLMEAKERYPLSVQVGTTLDFLKTLTQ